jgi:hypothetical protein
LGRVFPLLSHWRKYWTSHHHHRSSCRWASGHRAESRVQDSTTPNKHFQSEHQLDQRGLKYIHA